VNNVEGVVGKKFRYGVVDTLSLIIFIDIYIYIYIYYLMLNFFMDYYYHGYRIDLKS
jgi:hypothetical protein